jgi:hypothetical protein
MKQDPPLDARCKDKFLVQSVPIPIGENPSVCMPEVNQESTLLTRWQWAELEKTSKTSIQERKIRCHYLPADGTSSNVNGEPQHYDDSSVLATSPPAYSPHVGSNGDDSTVDHRSPSSKNVDEEQESLPARGQPSNDVQSQLADANATIARLRKQLDEPSGLRRRKADDTKDVTSPTADVGVSVLQHRAEGVPVEWAAILCLIVFLITYVAF